MKTPIQQLLDYTTDLLLTFDSEERVAMEVLDYLKTNKKAMLEKEKEIAQQYAEFAIECDRKELPVLEFDGWINL